MTERNTDRRSSRSGGRSMGAEGGAAARNRHARRQSAPGATQAPVVGSRTIGLPSQHAQASLPTASSPPATGLAPAGQVAKALQAV